MTPKRRLTNDSARHPTAIQEVFVGLAFDISGQHGALGSDERTVKYRLIIHDGTGVVEAETFSQPYDAGIGDEVARVKMARRLLKEVMGKLMDLQRCRMMDVRIVAIAKPIPEELSSVKGVEFASTIWLHLDAIPFIIITPATPMFTKLPALSIDTGAISAVQGALKYLHPTTHSATTADTDPDDHHVLVDCDGRVKLCSLAQYEATTSPELWTRFQALSTQLKSHHTSIAFFSATPQGGGVALMRHALIRLWKLAGVDVKWYTPEGHPAIFDITKRKIHNVLQGVSDAGEEMTEEDKKWFEDWTEQNYERFWAEGAINADLIIIDDPQLAALIPILKKIGQTPRSSSGPISRSSLTDNLTTPQHRTWNYLYSFIQHVDLFLAHPVEEFVPKIVKDSLHVLYMAPSTDPLDGLNKPYGTMSVNYYRQIFNQLAREQGGIEIDWDRGYICQIGRFDPSKGIDILLEAYLQFRQRLLDSALSASDNVPQLIIMGHGSIDDPDGTRIYEEIHTILASEKYRLVKDDVAVVRAPPSDSLLGCILQGAWVATQLSTREGFEIKVTEAIHKGVPIIASDAGGIPLQIEHGRNGWIVPTGDAKAVSSLLLDIYTGKTRLEQHGGPIKEDSEVTKGRGPNEEAEKAVADFGGEGSLLPVNSDVGGGGTSEDFWTVGNATKWMWLASRLLGLAIDHDGIEQGLVDEMGSAEEVAKSEFIGNVWKLVMGDEMREGEGDIRG